MVATLVALLLAEHDVMNPSKRKKSRRRKRIINGGVDLFSSTIFFYLVLFISIVQSKSLNNLINNSKKVRYT
jgi:hypothetical protein